MANLNRVILAGNLTRDPQLTYTPSNTAVVKFGLAINRKWTDRNTNQQREETTFVDCTAFARQGETINQYLTKGSPILLEGRLQYSTWTGQDGQKKSKLEVVVENFQFIGAPRGDRGPAGAPRERQPAAAPMDDGQPVSVPMDEGPPAAAYGDADVPF